MLFGRNALAKHPNFRLSFFTYGTSSYIITLISYIKFPPIHVCFYGFRSLSSRVQTVFFGHFRNIHKDPYVPRGYRSIKILVYFQKNFKNRVLDRSCFSISFHTDCNKSIDIALYDNRPYFFGRTIDTCITKSFYRYRLVRISICDRNLLGWFSA